MGSKRFPFYRQLDHMDCGPTCLKMIAQYYGKSYPLPFLRRHCYITKNGVSLAGIGDAAEDIGFRTMAIKCSYDVLVKEVPLPCIAHVGQNHFVVLYKIKKETFYVADPGHGLLKYSKEEFKKRWQVGDQGEGILLLFETTPQFYTEEYDQPKARKFRFFLGYLRPYKAYIYQIFLGLFAGSILTFILPFLTKSIVDQGIGKQDLNFITLILIGQLMLFFSQTAIQVFRNWLLLHMGARIKISILSDYLIKMLKLPLGFFESKNAGDILQRITDNERLQDFLSTTTISTLFSLFNILVFGIILIYYDWLIFAVFLSGAVLYIIWTTLFLNKRKQIDYKRFTELSQNNSTVMQLIQGVHEIKTNNSEKKRRWEWERIRVRLFKLSVKGLLINQLQNTGGGFINELKNILLTFIAAFSVVKGEMTLGMMLSVQYIIGQLNGPLNQFVEILSTGQDARISLERLNEVYSEDDEDSSDSFDLVPQRISIAIEDLSFRYGSRSTPLILKDLSFNINEGEKVAIVGTSGSGKTTLLKLLLKFYEPTSGYIKCDQVNLSNIRAKDWRRHCGAVLQDGFIFSDTIARNIAESDEEDLIDNKRMFQAAKIANIDELIESLPNGYNTKIGGDGLSLSGGQKQRILIARAVYKDPEFILFDEATSALDANTEKAIMENLSKYLKNKTAVIIAHRLSTVKNADKILVLEHGEIVEQGKHAELVKKKGVYYNLVKNQLELGS